VNKDRDCFLEYKSKVRFEFQLVDLRECQQYATQTMSAGQSAAAGAVAGALFGAILASAAGSRYDTKTQQQELEP
jgi:hypothetical protein